MKKSALVGLLGAFAAAAVWGLIAGVGTKSAQTVGTKPTPAVAEWVAAKGLTVEERESVKVGGWDANGMTLMHYAAEEGRVDVLEWLKGRGVNLNAKTGLHAKTGPGRTPLQYARHGGIENTVAWLEANGAE